MRHLILKGSQMAAPLLVHRSYEWRLVDSWRGYSSSVVFSVIIRCWIYLLILYPGLPTSLQRQ